MLVDSVVFILFSEFIMSSIIMFFGDVSLVSFPSFPPTQLVIKVMCLTLGCHVKKRNFSFPSLPINVISVSSYFFNNFKLLNVYKNVMCEINYDELQEAIEYVSA